MTNKQTIDGVSIEQLKRDDRLFHVAKNWRGCGRGWVKFICDEGAGLVCVRHENGAVPTVKLSNLQMRAMTPEQELSEFYEELSTGGKLTKRALCHIKSLQAEIAALNRPAAQPQGEVELLREEMEIIRPERDLYKASSETMEDFWREAQQHLAEAIDLLGRVLDQGDADGLIGEEITNFFAGKIEQSTSAEPYPPPKRANRCL